MTPRVFGFERICNPPRRALPVIVAMESAESSAHLRLGREMKGRELLYSPGGALGPVAQGCCGPSGGLVGMAGCAGVGDFILVRHGGSDEGESVRAHLHVGQFCGDLRHVTRFAAAFGWPGFVVGG